MKKIGFKQITLLLMLLLVLFIFALIFEIVTHSDISNLTANIVSPEIRFSIKLSLLTAALSTLMCIFVAIPVSYALARYDFPLKTLINTILDMPLALPPIVSGLGLLLIFGTSTTGHYLANMGLKFVFTPAGIIIAQFTVNISLMIRILRSTFESINPRYEHVAQTLGCTPFQAFIKTTLPLAKNGIFAGSVITWAKGMGEFGAVLILAGATRMKTETLPIALYLNMSSGELDLAIAAATILICISGITLYLFERKGGMATLY
ncbi:ABC transporter permease [Methanohalophilus halophilus]|uniref:ABC transporter permease subunit n=1 Tax=Methanohalophilus halophilus TaxID=2177 RepID=A0A1L3Q311_9EURY|nr:ABC transporter permease [Methanohalophilus halophilus]APH39257.1 molybdenum ABC transporter permease [Methanohalophilus halophilus]RNI09680.1 ABC transporter permease subunit [Methanohalophilus halophilus]SDW52462.1 molybdate transport system permease protein [Methanohalophilus halophilus]